MTLNTGERIRDLRLAAGLSQDQLAELASLNRVTVAKYEAGRIEPGAQALSRIADALDVSADVLLGKSAEKFACVKTPKTSEARIVSLIVDGLQKDQRAQVLNVVRAMYPNRVDLSDQEDLPLMG